MSTAATTPWGPISKSDPDTPFRCRLLPGQLHDAQDVALRVAKPGRSRGSRGHDRVDGLEVRVVVLLECHTPGLEVADLTLDVRSREPHARLRRLAGVRRGKDDEARPFSGLVHHAAGQVADRLKAE